METWSLIPDEMNKKKEFFICCFYHRTSSSFSHISITFFERCFRMQERILFRENFSFWKLPKYLEMDFDDLIMSEMKYVLLFWTVISLKDELLSHRNPTVCFLTDIKRREDLLFFIDMISGSDLISNRNKIFLKK